MDQQFTDTDNSSLQGLAMASSDAPPSVARRIHQLQGVDPSLLIGDSAIVTGASLRELRQAAGLSQLQLCVFAGFGRSTLQRYEAGEVPVQGPAVAKLVKAVRRCRRDIAKATEAEGSE